MESLVWRSKNAGRIWRMRYRDDPFCLLASILYEYSNYFLDTCWQLLTQISRWIFPSNRMTVNMLFKSWPLPHPMSNNKMTSKFIPIIQPVNRSLRTVIHPTRKRSLNCIPSHWLLSAVLSLLLLTSSSAHFEILSATLESTTHLSKASRIFCWVCVPLFRDFHSSTSPRWGATHYLQASGTARQICYILMVGIVKAFAKYGTLPVMSMCSMVPINTKNSLIRRI